MSSVVLARKYRPPNFAALVGQEHVVQALVNALTRQRLHHAYLFTGTRGVGKTTISRILAKSLNCTGVDGQGGITAQPCGLCDACRDIDTGRFVDYVELDAASNRGVDEITQLLDQAVYKPVLGRFKVYMVDEVHMLSNHAFNAMLKTLEEPPDYLKFVLATTDPQKVPPTVLSRCLQFNLRPMAAQTVQQHLGHVLEQEQLTAEAGALRLLARAARGSMRDALSLTDQAIAFGAGALTEAGVRQMLGAVDRGHAVRIVEALAAGDGAALMAAADALRALGLSAAGTLEELAALLQQLAVLQVLPEAADASDPEAAELVRLTPVLAPDETQLYYSLALHGREELALAPDEYSGLAMVLLRMLAFRPQAGHATRTPPAPGSALEPTAPSGLTVATAVQPARASPVAIPVATRPPPSAPVASSPARPASDGGGPRLALPAASLVRSAGGAAARSPAPRSVGDRVAELPADEPPPWMDAPFEHEAGAIGPGSTPRLAVTAESTRTRSIDPADAPAHASDDRRTGAVAVFIPTELGDRWEALVGRLNAAGRISAFARELAMQAQCLALDTDDASVRCHLRVERETLRAEAPRDKLQAALAEELQRPVALTVDGGAAQDSPVQREQAERARRQAQAERIIHDDPMVRALLAQYPTARLVPGSIKPAA